MPMVRVVGAAQQPSATAAAGRGRLGLVEEVSEVHEWLTAARDADLAVITSAAVLVEVIPPWTLSRLRVEPVTQALSQSAATLLRAAGLHGHKYAINAVLCATALTQPGRVTILTSDVGDISMLTADHPRVTAEKVRSVSSWLPMPEPWGAQVVVQRVSGRCSVIQWAARSPEAAVRTAAAMTVVLRPRVSARMPAAWTSIP